VDRSPWLNNIKSTDFEDWNIYFVEAFRLSVIFITKSCLKQKSRGEDCFCGRIFGKRIFKKEKYLEKKNIWKKKYLEKFFFGKQYIFIPK